MKCKSILKSGPDISLLSFSFHIFHKFKYFSFLFLFNPILGPETKQERIKDHRSNNGNCVYDKLLFFYSLLTVKFLNRLFFFLNIIMMHIPLSDLVIKKIFKRLGSVNFQLCSIICIQFPYPESHSLLLVHFPKLSLLMQSYLYLVNMFTSSKSVCFFFLKNFSYS